MSQRHRRMKVSVPGAQPPTVDSSSQGPALQRCPPQCQRAAGRNEGRRLPCPQEAVRLCEPPKLSPVNEVSRAPNPAGHVRGVPRFPPPRGIMQDRDGVSAGLGLQGSGFPSAEALPVQTRPATSALAAGEVK